MKHTKQKWNILTISAVLIMLVAVLCLSSCGKQGGNAGEGDTELYANANVAGTEIQTMKKSAEDKKYHEVTYKITGFISDSDKATKEVEKYNNSGASSRIGELTDGDTQYVIAKYEVNYPESFPAGEYGVMEPGLDFTIVNSNGGKKFKIGNTEYSGMNKTWEIGTLPTGYDFYPGSTYEGKIVYIMKKGYDKYLLKESYRDGQDEAAHFIRPTEDDQ